MRALVFAAGDPLTPERMLGSLHPADLVIAADGGAQAAREAGLEPGVVVGDMDSLDPQSLNRLASSGAEILRHPMDKNETDLELALDLAAARGAGEVLILGALGGRADHALANLLLAGSSAYRDLEISLLGPGERIHWLHPGRRLTLEGQAGDTLSLVPLGGPASGVCSENLAFPLDREELLWGKPRGVSNRLTATRASVWLASGTLAVFHNR